MPKLHLATNGHALDKSKTNPLVNSSGFDRDPSEMPSRTSYHPALCFSSSVIFLLVDTCVGLNWLLVSFFYHTLIKTSFILSDMTEKPAFGVGQKNTEHLT